MSDNVHGGGQAGPTQRAVEIGVAIAIAIFALIVIGGGIEAGIGWGAEGPKSGFFPFYVGLTILISSIVNLTRVRAEATDKKLFAEWGQLRQVLSVVVPTAIYVSVMPWTGIYFSSAVLIGYFMKRLGNYGWHVIAPIAIGIPLVTFVVFERWFLVALPKGPIEYWLGF